MELQILEVAILKPEPSSVLGITCDPTIDGIGVRLSALAEGCLAAKVCESYLP